MHKNEIGLYCKWLPFTKGWFYQKKLTFKAQTVLRSGSYDFDTSRINMVDTSNEKIHPLFHSLTNSYSIYRVGSLSRTIKRYDGVATQGSSILILFVQYISPTNLNKCIYYWARTYSILIYLVGGSAHEYTDMCWCCIHFKFIYIPLQSRSTIKIQPLPRRSEQISVICYLAWVLRKQLANMSIKIVQFSQFCVKTVSLY